MRSHGDFSWALMNPDGTWMGRDGTAVLLTQSIARFRSKAEAQMHASGTVAMPFKLTGLRVTCRQGDHDSRFYANAWYGLELVGHGAGATRDQAMEDLSRDMRGLRPEVTDDTTLRQE